MKKIFTLFAAIAVVISANAQQHATAMQFAGKAHVSVTQFSYDADVASDTVIVSDGNTAVTLPAISGKGMTIPAMKIGNLTYTMTGSYQTGDMAFVWEKADTTFTVEEKSVNLTNFKVTYEHAKNKLTVTTNIKYGAMPAILTYTQEGYYLKDVAGTTNISISDMYNYTATPTYRIRKYIENEVEKLDVEIPSYSIANTEMGDLTIGTYTIKGLTYDSEKGGYYRDYANDGLKMHFKAVKNDVTLFDDDYALATAGGENILVQYSGTNIAYLRNNFQPGAMPYTISEIYGTPTAINAVAGTGNSQTGTKKVMKNGRLVIVKDGLEFSAAGQRIK